MCFSHSGEFLCVFGVEGDAGVFGSEVTSTPALQISLDFIFSARERVRARGCLCVYISIMENGAVVFERFAGQSWPCRGPCQPMLSDSKRSLSSHE